MFILFKKKKYEKISINIRLTLYYFLNVYTLILEILIIKKLLF